MKVNILAVHIISRLVPVKMYDPETSLVIFH